MNIKDVDLCIDDPDRFRIERMSDQQFWIRIYTGEQNDIVIWLASESSILCSVEYD